LSGLPSLRRHRNDDAVSFAHLPTVAGCSARRLVLLAAMVRHAHKKARDKRRGQVLSLNSEFTAAASLTVIKADGALIAPL
jgi:hypothetical protein